MRPHVSHSIYCPTEDALDSALGISLLLAKLRRHLEYVIMRVFAVQIIHSKNDSRTECSASKAFIEASTCPDKLLLDYDDGAHQLLQDTPEVQARVKDDLTGWILKHVPA